MPRIAIYARKSSESEDRQVLSIDSQISELQSLANREGLQVTEVFTESQSAKAPGRPVFNRLLGLIQKGKIDTVFCWKLDRLARNPIDGGAIIWAFEEQKLVSIQTPGRSYLNTSNDKFWQALEFGIAKKYVDELSENVKRGMRAKLQMGGLPGLPPMGYRNDRNDRTIVRDLERFDLVRRMWDLMLTGNYRPPQILRIATDNWGFRTRKFKRQGGKPMRLSMMKRMFHNPFYCGIILRKGEQYLGAHEPMVSHAEFERVQQLMGGNHRPRPRKHTFAYTGMIRCGECGATITAEDKRNRHGYRYVYYHCTKQKSGVICSQKVIEVGKLEEQISSFLRSITIPKEFKEWVVESIRELHDDEVRKDRIQTESLMRQQQAIKAKLSDLVDLRLQKLLDDDEYLAKKTELVAEQARTRELAADGDKRFDDVLEHCEDALEFAATAGEIYANGTLEDKKACLQYVGAQVTLKDRKLYIIPHFPFSQLQKTIALKGFEPGNLRFNKRQNTPNGSVLSSWWDLSSVFRKFYREHLTLPTFKRLLLGTVRTSFSIHPNGE